MSDALTLADIETLKPEIKNDVSGTRRFLAFSSREGDAALGDAIFYEAAFKMGRLTTPGLKNLDRACHQYNQLGYPVYIPPIPEIPPNE